MHRNINTVAIWFFIVDYFQNNLMIKIFKKCEKYHFWPILPKTEPLKIRAQSVFNSHEILHSCKKLEKPNEPILRKSMNRQTDK